jgi:hypothetical protein
MRNIQASLDIFKLFWANWIKQIVLILRIIQVNKLYKYKAYYLYNFFFNIFISSPEIYNTVI